MSKNPHAPPKTIRCPVCGYEMDSAEVAVGTTKRPRPEDLTLCLNCGEVLVFTDTMEIRPAELRDYMQLDADAFNTVNIGQKLIRQRGPIPRP